MNEKQYVVILAENAVALSSAIFDDPRYAAYYKEHGQNGITAIWAKIAEIAIHLTEAERRQDRKQNWIDESWIDTVDSVATLFLCGPEPANREAWIQRIMQIQDTGK